MHGPADYRLAHPSVGECAAEEVPHPLLVGGRIGRMGGAVARSRDDPMLDPRPDRGGQPTAVLRWNGPIRLAMDEQDRHALEQARDPDRLGRTHVAADAPPGRLEHPSCHETPDGILIRLPTPTVSSGGTESTAAPTIRGRGGSTS